MAIDLATQFSPHVDEEFSTESKKSLVTNSDYSWNGAHSVRVYTVSTSELHDYDRNGSGENWNRFGPVAGLDATVTEYTLTQDKSFVFAVDKMDVDETKQALEAAAALARQVRQRVIPAVDAYTFGKMCTGAGVKPDALALTDKNIYEAILAGTESMDNNEVPESGRVLIVSPSTYTLLKKSRDVILETDIGNDLRLKGVLAIVDGMTIMKAPSNRLPTDFGFLIAHPVATCAPTKLEDFRIHRDPPGISGSLIEGRIVFDAFVLKNKKNGLYYQTLPAATPPSGGNG